MELRIKKYGFRVRNAMVRLATKLCFQSIRQKSLTQDDEITFWEDYEVVQCQGCKTISFRVAWRDSGDIFQDGEEGYEFNEQELIYPGRVAGRHQLRNSPQLPSKILGIYYETHAALCNKLHVLTGMGIRALIEAVCKDKFATGKN